jgi:hypothetical protein
LHNAQYLQLLLEAKRAPSIYDFMHLFLRMFLLLYPSIKTKQQQHQQELGGSGVNFGRS